MAQRPSGEAFDRELFLKLRADAKDRIRGDGRLTPAARAVGGEIMDLVHTERRFAWCSEDELAQRLKLKDRKTVQRAVKQLCDAGWLWRWRIGRANRYVPLWLRALKDTLSRQVVAAAGPKGDKLSPIAPGKGTFSSRIGDKNHPWIGDKNHPLSLSFNPFSIPGPVDKAPAAAGDLTAAAAGASNTRSSSEAVAQSNTRSSSAPRDSAALMADSAKKTQRELPLLRQFSGDAPPRRRDAENAAHERVYRGTMAALGEAFGDFIGTVSGELEEQAIEAEIAQEGAGVKLLVAAWRDHRSPARGDTKGAASGDAGAGYAGSAAPTHAETVRAYLDPLEDPTTAAAKKRSA